ncbi:MAG TPA: HlyD family secretion protein [Stellaceae bacterium]|jgi:membrane fusion protein (multidrug efflux system)
MAADGGSTGLKAEARTPQGRTVEPPVKERKPDRAPPQTVPAKSAGRRKHWLRWALFLLLPIVLIVGLYFYMDSTRYVSTDDAYVEADQVGLSTDVSGLVQKIDVRENQRVVAGQPLFSLDPQPFQLKLDQAQAQLGVVHDNIDALKANYESLQAQIVKAQDQLAFDQRQYDRQAILAREKFAPETALDQAWMNLRAAQQSLTSLRAQLAATAANLDGNPKLPPEQYSQYRQALAQRDEAARELRDTVVRAPYAGYVTNVPSLQPGKYLPASTTGFYLVRTPRVWVEAQPKETKLTYVRPGQPVTVTVDTYPGRRWHGTVESIAPAAQSQFSLLPAENTSGNWVKVVQRIPLRVGVATNPGQMPPLRSGMSAEIEVDTGRVHGVPKMFAWLFGGSQSG